MPQLPYKRRRQRAPLYQRIPRALRNRARVLFLGNNIWQVVIDSVLIAAAYWLAFYVRFDSGTPAFYERAMFETIGWIVLIKILVFVLAGIYDKWWRYLSVKDMESVLQAIVLASVASVVFLYGVQPAGAANIPRSVIVLDFAFTIFLVAGIRFLARSWFERPALFKSAIRNAGGPTVVVAGAGNAGRSILREMQRLPLGYNPIGIVDDDDRKQQIRLEGVPVIGTTDDLPEIIRTSGVDEVIIAMPSADGSVVQRIYEMCQAQGVTCRTLPAVHELVAGNYRNLTTKLREVQVEDVLGREPIHVDLAGIAAYVTDQTVLVTGAGGSIGSELCRQITRVNPGKLVMVDHAENSLFFIDHELTADHPNARHVPVVADLKNRQRMRRVFEEHRPTVVFHAGAYKHVPMMECNPTEAVQNNSFGTQAMCELSDEYNVERFVLVSTDKAVEPSTVMGQSKALAEWIVQAYDKRSEFTRFMAVRFGNVLGSNGSVVPIFRQQIEDGGPVTVTDENMTRYFMTIPEAVQLIIQAGAMGDGGEIFVLDMGKPVRIMDLAENMIRLSGHTPGDDIKIEVVGLRPGEKLDEVLFAGDETVETTAHDKIWRARSAHRVAPGHLIDELSNLGDLVDNADTEAMGTRLKTLMKPRIEAGALELEHT